MTGDEFKKLIEEDRSLTLGLDVTVFWTNSNRYFRARGKVSKLNEKSVKVRLEEAVGQDFFGGYPVGHQITVPRIMAIERWTCNNCVRIGLATSQVPS